MAVMTLGTYARWVWPMTVLVFCTGAMVVGSGVLVNLLTPAQEIPLWFNVPVCPTDDTRAKFVGQDLKARNGGCPTAGAESQPVAFHVLRQWLIPGATYNLAAFLPTRTRLLELRARVIDVDSLQAVMSVDTGATGDAWDAWSRAEAAAGGGGDAAEGAEPATGAGGADPGQVASTGRRLLKGSSSSSTRYWHSYGRHSYSYYRKSRRRTPVGWASTGVVASAEDPVVVQVYSRGTLGGSRFHGMASILNWDSCANAAKGCEYELKEPYSPMFFDGGTVMNRQNESPLAAPSLRLVVEHLVVESSLGDALASQSLNPEVFFTMTTSARTWHHSMWWLVPLGIALLVVGSLAWACAQSHLQYNNGDLRSTSFAYCGIAAAVVRVSAKSNDISTVVGLSRFRNLQHLDLGNNDLKRFNGGDAAKLHTLVLESNDMTTLQSSRFPSSLRVLNVRSNDLKRITVSDVSDLQALQVLDASDNDLVDVSGLVDCPNLRVVNLHNNDLKDPGQIVAMLRRLGNLQLVDVRSNEFSARARQTIRDTVPLATACVVHA